MAKNLLVINVDIRETRVALIEDGIIAELHIERETSKGTLGNVYLGKVSRVLPGMQAAFIDVGLERAAFLHVEDLIRPDDFEAYLAGHRKTQDEDRASGPTPEQALADHDVAHAHPEVPGEPQGEPIEVEVDLEHASPDELHEEAAAELEAESRGPDGEAPVESEPDVSVDVDVVEHVEHVEAHLDAADDELPAEGAPVVALELEQVGLVGAASAPEPRTPSRRRGRRPREAAADQAPPAEVFSYSEEALPREDGPSANPAENAGHGAEDSLTELHVDAAELPQTDASETADAPSAEAGEAQVVGAETGDAVPHARRRSRGGRVRRSGRTTDRGVATSATADASREGRDAVQQGRAPQQAQAPGAAPNAPRDSRGQGAGQQQQQPQQGRDGQRRDGRDNNRRGRNDRGGRGGRGGQQGGRDAQKKPHDPMRVSKATPIREVVREGQEVVVQISKEPIGTKGARVTSHVSLAGRYVVYLPTVEHVGISKRIGSDKERARLREAMDAMKPPQGGLIVRTLAEGLTKKHLKSDVGYLVRLWGEIVKKREGARAPVCLYTELDLVTKTARDLFTDDIEKIVIDSREEYVRLQKFIEMFMPERVDAVELYEDAEPIFDAYGIEEEIQRAQSRKVPLPSGGHLIIDQAEALTAIDVNTGRFVGKGSKDLEETILATNLEAVREIAYQLRFRNIGGLIILDLIDMDRAGSREKVRKRLEELLAKDKAKTTLNRISDLGLIEMTRKRTRESLGRIVLEPCFYCDGTGQLQSKQTIVYEILRQIKRERSTLPGYVIVVNAHPSVVDTFKSDERVALTAAEKLFQRRIELIPRKEYHLEQFDLQGK